MRRTYGVANRNTYKVGIAVCCCMIIGGLFTIVAALTSNELTRRQGLVVSLSMLLPLTVAPYIIYIARQRLKKLRGRQIETKDGIFGEE